MPGPLVSVIVPTYDRSNVIRRCVMSILNQTQQSLEVLVVDNGSSDDTDSVIASIPDSRVRYERYTKRQSAAASRNYGVGLATGKYVAFLDSDDEWLPDHLECAIRLMERDCNIKGVLGAFYVLQEGRALPRPRRVFQGENMVDYILGSGGDARTSTFVFHRQAFLNVRFDEDLRKHQDWDLAIRFSRAFTLRWQPKPTVIIHKDSSDRMSRRMDHDATYYFLSKHAAAASGRSVARFSAALALWTARLEGPNRMWCTYMRRALVMRPLDAIVAWRLALSVVCAVRARDRFCAD